MVKIASRAALLIALVLSGCSTADVLTPQVDVPGGVSGQQQAAVTNRLAQPPARVTTPAPVETTAYAPQNSMEAQQQAMGIGAPPTTLEAQAEALARAGQAPFSANDAADTASAETQAAASPPPAAAEPQQVAALSPAASGTIRFLPIIGAPVEAVTPLSRQLGAEARSRGLTIKSSSDPNSEHILKGYFSAFDNGGTTAIVYVWDVLDGSGARLHRIQGQEAAGPAGGDPWATVPASVMQTIATRTMDLYMAWKQGRTG